MYDITLTTDRLLLRQLRDDDLDAYAVIAGDPEVMRFLGERRPMSRMDAWRQMAMILGHWELRGYGYWALEERATGRLAGRAGFMNPDGWPGIECGWTLGREFWGRGYATEAARAIFAWGFEYLRLDRIISLIDPENLPSIRVAERLGETRSGSWEFLGHPHDIYAISRDQWQAGSGA
jgi:RimJ/RimL family protein N-acetyltransferase